jgi:hypothetical protein
VDSPSQGEVLPCIGFWFLNRSVCQVCLHCIAYHVISYSCLALCLRNRLFYPFFYFLLIAFQILHVFLPDILVNYALIKYAYV